MFLLISGGFDKISAANYRKIVEGILLYNER